MGRKPEEAELPPGARSDDPLSQPEGLAGLAAGEVVADRYRVERVIATGGMSTVYAATNLMTRADVALKWMPPAFRDPRVVERFLREARTCAQLEHPNIVRVFDMDRYKGSLYIVMEFLYGEPFSKRLERGRPKPRRLVEIMLSVLQGVDAAHREGVVHRDLKPANIYLCRSKRGEPREPKVLDFGVAKAWASSQPMANLTSTGVTVGTPYYMSPEQACGARDVDGRSDIYSLGVMMYEATAGDVPFRHGNYNEIMMKIIDGLVPPLRERAPHAPKPLIDVIERAMASRPELRYRSATEMSCALEACLPQLDAAEAERAARLSSLSSTPALSAEASALSAKPNIAASAKPKPRAAQPVTVTPSSRASLQLPLSRWANRELLRRWLPLTAGIVGLLWLTVWLTRGPAQAPAIEEATRVADRLDSIAVQPTPAPKPNKAEASTAGPDPTACASTASLPPADRPTTAASQAAATTAPAARAAKGPAEHPGATGTTAAEAKIARASSLSTAAGRTTLADAGTGTAALTSATRPRPSAARDQPGSNAAARPPNLDTVARRIPSVERKAQAGLAVRSRVQGAGRERQAPRPPATAMEPPALPAELAREEYLSADDF